jgi:hypothetical protein
MAAMRSLKKHFSVPTDLVTQPGEKTLQHSHHRVLMLLLFLFALVLAGCGTTEELFFSADETICKSVAGHSALLIPVAAEAIQVDSGLDAIRSLRGGKEHVAEQMKDSLNHALLVDCIGLFAAKQPGKVRAAYALPFSYSLGSKDLKNIVQQTGDDTLIYSFTLPSEKFLKQTGYNPEVLCAITQISFSRGNTTEGYYQDGIFHGGETPVLKAKFDFVFFDYTIQQCISYGTATATALYLHTEDAGVWHSLFQQIYRKLFLHSPWAISNR